MERLTEKKTSCWIRTRAGNDYTNYSKDWNVINKLAELEDLQESGRMIILPCAAGDTAYGVTVLYLDKCREVNALQERIRELESALTETEHVLAPDWQNQIMRKFTERR